MSSGVSSGVVGSILNNDSPSLLQNSLQHSSARSTSKHRSSYEDSGTPSILMFYFICVLRRYLTPAHTLANFKGHRMGPLQVKLVNKAHHEGVVGNIIVQRSRFKPGTSRFPVQRSTAAPH